MLTYIACTIQKKNPNLNFPLLFWPEIWGDLVKISHEFLCVEREDVAGNSNLCHASMNSAPLQITVHCFSLSLICLTKLFF